MNENDSNGWVKLWTKSGAQVTLPVPFADPQSMLAYAESYIAAGWLINAPNLNAGEYKETIGFVCRMSVISKRDGVKVDKIALYPNNPGTMWKCGQVYLDTADDVAAFEEATGLSLSSLQEYPSDAAPKRDGSGAQYIVPVQRPTVAIFKKNDKYVEGSKEQPKNHFARWDGTTPQTGASVPASTTNTQTPTPPAKNANTPATVAVNGTSEAAQQFDAVGAKQLYVDNPDGSITVLKTLTRADVVKLQTKWNALNVSNAEIMTALGVDRASLFEGDYADADERVEEFHKSKEIAF